MTGEGGGTPGFANVNEMWAYQPVDLGSIDTDGDGLPDYIEDSDGDGVSDTGESDWTLSNSGLTTGSDVIIFTPLK